MTGCSLTKCLDTLNLAHCKDPEFNFSCKTLLTFTQYLNN